MAQEPESERNASGIARTSKRKWGYDSEQVDAFLERAHMLYEGEGAQLTQHDIQNVSFELVKGSCTLTPIPNVSTANVSSQEKARNRAMTASKWIASSISA